MNQSSIKYDLEDRTANFSVDIIRFCKKFEKSLVANPIIKQLIRSGTSIGANYMEANGASSRRDFANKIFICKKESQETKHWLRMLLRCCPQKVNKINTFWKEAQELTLIFQKITSSLKH